VKTVAAARLVVVLALLPFVALHGSEARADAAAARGCAARLPKDARAIFDTTLPKVGPGTDLRDLVSAATRRLVMDGKIDRGSARSSAMAAAKCLRLAGP